ncbi:hypothetical protein Rs2_23116 [Raphanus sativus]|nr:hypothetical protein Rs2_23116 [Raphanus sativus]
MALEQCHYPRNALGTNYISFLDYLIEGEKDADLLIKKGINKNLIGDLASVAGMVNKFGLGIAESESCYYYSGIAGQVNNYSENWVNRSEAVLKHVYFGNLWTGTERRNKVLERRANNYAAVC